MVKTYRKPGCPCVHCERGVRSNSRAISCDGCDRWVYLACSDITREQYDEMCRGSVVVDYYCNSCQISFLPNAEIESLTTFPEDSIRNAPDDGQSVEGGGDHHHPSEAYHQSHQTPLTILTVSRRGVSMLYTLTPEASYQKCLRSD